MNVQSTIGVMNALKLNGMADAYQAICQLPADKQPDTHECLATILDAEQQHRTFRKSAMLVRLSKLRYQANIRDISFDKKRNLDKQTVAALADCSFIQRAHNVIITGATGCGKSYLACALGYQACMMGHRTLYFNMNRFCEQITIAKLDGSFIKLINRIQKAKLIISDDFGLQPLDHKVKLALLQILEDRYRNAATMIASQILHTKWHEYFDDPTIADAILDRITADCTKIILKGLILPCYTVSHGIQYSIPNLGDQ